MKKNIGNVLREKRIESGLSIKEVSSLLISKGFKASDKTIYSWESGNSQPSLEILLELCDIYNIKDILLTFGYDGYNEDGSIQLNIKEQELIEKYRSLDTPGQNHVDAMIKWETERVQSIMNLTGQINGQGSQIAELEKKLRENYISRRLYAYHGKIAAAGTGVGFSDIVGMTIEVEEEDAPRSADYCIGVNGDSMEPDYYDGDVVYVRKTTHLNRGDVGIFQKDNNIYIKKVGDGVLVSSNPAYSPISGEDVLCLGLVIGKVMGEYRIHG